MEKQNINLKSYSLNESKYVESISSYVYILEHIKTKAKVMVISNDDTNKVFSIAFRTPPYNSTGLPHILEHSVLCGSRKFPVKDPFLELLKSSLQTFLNAFTAPDTTTYPCASCNDKDFNNLMDVYLDATLYPNIYKYEEIFKQEGWHYELEDKDSEVTINGVVYNEMKGAYSNPDQIVWSKNLESLYPDTCYSVSSGGDPDYIPTLSYEEFKAFHKKYYHPSNSYIVLYGNINIEERLDFMDKEYLSNFDYLKVDSEIQTQSPFDKVNYIDSKYQVSQDDDSSDKAIFSYNISLDGQDDILLSCAHSIISYCLFNAPGALIKDKLIKSKIGQNVFSEYEPSIKQPMFSIVAKNCKENDLDKFVSIIEKGLKKVCKEGIDELLLLSTINNFDFKDREKDFGSFPKGLAYAMDAVNAWIYDLHPLLKLDSEGVFDTLRSKVNTSYYTDIIKKYYIDNTHKSVVRLIPSNDIQHQKQQELKDKLKAYKDSLSSDEINKLIEDTQALKLYQQTPSAKEDYDKLPKLSRSDINTKVRDFKIDEYDINNIKVIHSNYDTLGINYFKLLFEFTNCNEEMIPYIGLVTSLFTELSTENYSYQLLNQQLNIHVGSLKVLPVSYEIDDNGNKKFFVEVSVKCFTNKTKEAIDLVCEILSKTMFTEYDRIYEIIQEQYASNSQSIISSGHVYSSGMALSYIDKSSYVGDLLGGIKYTEFVNEVFKNYESKKEEISTILNDICKNIFKTSNLIIHSTCPKEDFEQFKANLSTLSSLDEYSIDTLKYDFSFTKNLLNEGYKTSSNVQYVCKAGHTDLAINPGTIRVLLKILSTEYLWMKVRVDGGAYGCMCNITESGYGYFVSYRDPNLKRTLKVFDDIIDFIDNINFDDEKLTNFIIGAISGIDKPLTQRQLGERSLSNYFIKHEKSYLEKMVDSIVNCTIDDLKQLKAPIKEILETNSICVIGNENVIEENKDVFNNIKSL